MRSTLFPTTVLGLLSLAAAADPTWPSATDDLEEILFQLNGTRGRSFADNITPCSNEASGPGRQNAAEWLRAAFHDMAPYNRYFGTGGLDASLQYELKSSDNTGPGHGTTLQFMANYVSRQTSLSDLIAAGVYASVRSCGGPSIPLRTGRIDATEAGSIGVPQPQNSISTFVTQFDRMGFNQAEMIQLVACGHTLGGVHKAEFPTLVPNAPANGEVGFDSSVSGFDNKVVTEYLAGTTTNPLVVGPAAGSMQQNADGRIFNSDKNATVQALATPATFTSTCQSILQRMIDVVPDGVSLSTAPLTPYTVKPVNMQLTLQAGGATLLLSGNIRVRTTAMPSSSIAGVTLTYKDRNGGNNCGTCKIAATVLGQTSGFDDTFDFFPISAVIDATKGISSFTVTINMKDGTTKNFDNNGNSYPMSDAVMLQTPQSCLLQTSGALTVTAAVRNDRTSMPVNLAVSYQVSRTDSGLVTPSLSNATVAMTKQTCVGTYTLYKATYTITGGLSYNSRLDIISGTGAAAVSDSFKAASQLAGTCGTFTGASTCSNITTSTTTTSSSTSATPTPTGPSQPAKVGAWKWYGCQTEATNLRALSSATYANGTTMTLESCAAYCAGYNFFGVEYASECYCGNSFNPGSVPAQASDCSFTCAGNKYELCGASNRLSVYSSNGAIQSSSSSSSSSRSSTTLSTSTRTSTSSSVSPTGTLGIVQKVGAYSFVSCWTEGDGVRALGAKSYADDAMTLDSCATFCSSYNYFGTEYGRECYCGNAPDPSSVSALIGDCSFTCAGNPYQYCGAGNRLELYKKSSTTSSSTSSSTSTSRSSTTSTSTSRTSTSTSSSTSSSTRTTTTTTSSSSTSRSSTTSTSSTSRTSTTSTSTSTSRSTTTTSTSTSRTSTTTTSSTSHSTTTSSTTSRTSTTTTTSSTSRTTTTTSSTTSRSSTTSSTASATTLAHKPTVSAYSFMGCWTEVTVGRALADSSYASATAMTLESCAAYCKGHKYFATEYSGECYCGNSLDPLSSQASLSDCSMTCSGNSLEYCGGPSRLELYNTTSFTGPSQPAKVGSWSLYGCKTEGTGVRALSSTSYVSDSMTLESCSTFCAGYKYAGVEYARECYCGSTFGAGSANASQAECNMVCSGNSTEYCGGSNRLSVYAKL